MDRTTAEESLHAAVERCGGDTEVTTFAKNLSEVLRSDEFVLEIAQTTASGQRSACAVTTNRLVLGTGPDTLEEVPMEKITYWGFENEAELSLVLASMDARIVWHGFGIRGAERISHALRWLFNFYKVSDLKRTPETIASELFESWRQTHVTAEQEQWTEDHAVKEIMSVLVNKRWW